MKKLLFTAMIIMAASSVFAQHNHNQGNTGNLIVLFTTQNDQYSASVESETDKFLKDSIYSVNLLLSTSYAVEPGSVKLNVHKSNNTQDSKQMELIDSKYTAKMKFESEGKHAMEFTFNLVGAGGIVTGSGFSFTANVKNSIPDNMSQSNMNHHDMKQNEGMMGMGSTGLWIIMGGVMVAMMAVYMIISSHK